MDHVQLFIYMQLHNLFWPYKYYCKYVKQDSHIWKTKKTHQKYKRGMVLITTTPKKHMQKNTQSIFAGSDEVPKNQWNITDGVKPYVLEVFTLVSFIVCNIFNVFHNNRWKCGLLRTGGPLLHGNDNQNTTYTHHKNNNEKSAFWLRK